MPGRPGEDDGRPTATRPSSSRSTPSPSGSSRRPSSATCEERRRARTATSSSSAAPSRRGPGRDRHRRGLRARRRGQGRGDRDRQGLRGHDQAPQLPPRPEVARLAQRPQAGLDRRVGDAVARLQGHEDGRPDGRQARHPGRPARPRSTPSTTCCSSRAPSRARRTASSRSGRRRLMAAPKAPAPRRAGQEGEGRLARRGGVRRRGQAAPRARGRARRAERAARRARAREEPRARLRRPREAVAPEGHRPRAPGTTRAPHLTGGGVAFPPTTRTFDVKVNKKALKAALRSRAREPCAGRDARRSSTRRVRRAVHEAPRALVDDLGQAAPLVVVVHRRRGERSKSFRNLERVAVVASRRARGRRRRLGALAARLARRRSPLVAGEGAMSLHAGQVLLAPVVSEKSYEPDRAASTRSASTRTPTRRRSARPSRSSSTSRSRA